MRISVAFALLLAALAYRLPAQAADWCVPSPAVQAALEQLPGTLPGELDWQYEQKHLAALKELLTRFRGDLLLQRAYVESAYRRADKDKAIADYKARYESNPDDPVVAYLYATALMGRQSAEAIKILDAVLKKNPQFPWPHYSLAPIYGTPVFQNKDEKLKHVKAFLAACPESLDGYRELTGLDDKELLAAYAAKLRALLEPRTDMDAIRAYVTLWSIEFKAHPMSEYDGLRKQVSEDLKRIRALNWEDKRGWYYTLERGYTLVNDQAQADWARDERFGRWEPFVPVSAAKWFKDRPRPQKDDAAGKKTAYYAELLKLTGEWLKESPKSADIWRLRLEAMEHLDGIPATDVEAVSDRYLNLLESQAGPDGLDSDQYFTVARVLSEKHLQPERVLELAGKGLAQGKVEDSDPEYDSYATKESLQESDFYKSLHPMKGSGLEAEAYIQLKQAGKARLALARMEDELQATHALVGDKAEFKKQYSGRMATWWGFMARTAELQNHEQDAMAFYEHALLERLEAQEMPETGVPDEVAENARRLFTKLGGTNDGWQIWYGSRADNLASHAALTWEDADEPLPAFALPDLTGKMWTQESLKGKVTFLNFWASW
jgi:hypothetical protein